MTTKVLFFDTSAILKLFLKEEKGCDVMKWYMKNKATLRLHFVINEQVRNEFSNKIAEFSKTKPELNINAERTINLFSKHYVGLVFRAALSR